MKQKGFSHRRLAAYCQLRRSGMIDHLLAGRRVSCSPLLAHRIVEALDVPLEVLFEPKTPNVTRSVAQRDAA